MNLQGKLAGRGQHKHAHRAAHGNPGIDHALQQRQGEGSGLAGAGLGQAEDILAVEHRRNGLNLNGGGGNIAAVTDANVQTLVKRKRGKIHKWSCGWRKINDWRDVQSKAGRAGRMENLQDEMMTGRCRTRSARLQGSSLLTRER